MKNKETAPEASTKSASTKDVGAVVNAIQILRHLAHAEAPEGVAAIARATGISPSSAFNILRTLHNEQLASFDNETKTYQLGLGLSELAVSFIGRSYADLIQPELERLSLAHRILVALWQVTDDAHIRVIARSEPQIAHVNVAMGTRLPELVTRAPEMPGLLHAWLQQQVDGRHELSMRSRDLAELSRAVREAQRRIVAAILGIGALVAFAVLYALR